MSEERTEEEIQTMYDAISGSVSVINNCLNPDNEFCNDDTPEEKKARVMRSEGYMAMAVAFDDYGSRDMTAINTAIATAIAYDPDAQELNHGYNHYLVSDQYDPHGR